MDHRHLANLTDCLATFLARVLPGLSSRWWQTHVLDELSFQQQEHAERARHSRLDQLDLAALLRIADRNWSEVARSASLAPEARNWLKEAQSIRNRWAHAPATGIPESAPLPCVNPGVRPRRPRSPGSPTSGTTVTPIPFAV